MESKFDNEWNIWYHNSKEDWSINGYKKLYNIATIKDYWKFVIIWEIIENIIIPNSLVKLNYFKEDIRDINGDIIAAIPASIYLIYK